MKHKRTLKGGNVLGPLHLELGPGLLSCSIVKWAKTNLIYLFLQIGPIRHIENKGDTHFAKWAWAEFQTQLLDSDQNIRQARLDKLAWTRYKYLNLAYVHPCGICEK